MRRSSIFIVYFEHISHFFLSHIFLVFLLLTLNSGMYVKAVLISYYRTAFQFSVLYLHEIDFSFSSISI